MGFIFAIIFAILKVTDVSFMVDVSWWWILAALFSMWALRVIFAICIVISELVFNRSSAQGTGAMLYLLRGISFVVTKLTKKY